MDASRLKLPAILLTIVGAGLALLSWSQSWFELTIEAGALASDHGAVDVAGSVASPALAALGLAGLAIAPALAIAGPGIRIVLGVLEALLGGCILLAVWLTLGDPIAAVSAAVTDATGVSGARPTADLVASAVATLWPVLAIVGGVFVLVAGIAVVATGTRWPSSSRRYSDARLTDADASGSAQRPASDRAIDDWDELSRGDDPTDDPSDDTADDVSPTGPNR